MKTFEEWLFNKNDFVIFLSEDNASGVVDRKTITALANEFLTSLNSKLTMMIGKTLEAYKNKNSDAYSRAAITLDNYKKGLGGRYKEWIIKNWFNGNYSSPPMSEAYSLGDYRDLMYKVAVDFYAQWLQKPAANPEYENVKNHIRTNAGANKLALNQGTVKKIASTSDGPLNRTLELNELDQFINLLMKSGKNILNSSDLQKEINKIDQMGGEEFINYARDNQSKLNQITVDAVNKFIDSRNKRIDALDTANKNASNNDFGYKLGAVGGITTSAAGLFVNSIMNLIGAATPASTNMITGVLGAGAISSLVAIYYWNKNRKQTKTDQANIDATRQSAGLDFYQADKKAKESIADNYLANANAAINKAGRAIADKYRNTSMASQFQRKIS